MKPFRTALYSLLLFLPSSLWADVQSDGQLIEWVMDEKYAGAHSNAFGKLRYEVPVLMRQTLIDLSVRCGLDFQEGWRFPIVIRFVDGSPMGVENALAYVQLMQDEQGGMLQTLNINLIAYERERFNFDAVFAHELVHAMLNDSLGEESSHLPVWFHEGLAVYGASQGEKMLEAYVAHYPGVPVSYFIDGLEGPRTALDYAEDYLAFKYIYDQHGVNSLRNLIQDVIKTKGDVRGAIERTCFENWAAFEENARKFAEEEISRLGRQRMPLLNDKKPY